jgi:hypothetical protein
MEKELIQRAISFNIKLQWSILVNLAPTANIASSNYYTKDELFQLNLLALLNLNSLTPFSINQSVIMINLCLISSHNQMP